MKTDRMYLEHIRECIEKITRYCQKGRNAFFDDELVQDGVIRNFEIMGEAAKNLSTELRQANPEIPWRDIAGFRDVLIHNYAGVKIGEVWRIVEDVLPSLHSKILSLLKED